MYVTPPKASLIVIQKSPREHQGIKVPTKSKSIITTNVTYTCLSSITALFLSPQNHELLSVGRLPSHSQKQREKHDENPKTLHAEASYLSLSLSI